MGRRFPEFCALRAACRVSVRASPFATGDRRIAAYQAAIDSVGARHYTHWPFMVEVLNKWLEANRDFVRDPLGCVVSSSSPAPAPTTTSIQDTASRITTLIPGHATTQRSPAVADNQTLSPPCNAEASKQTADLSPAASATGMEPNDRVNPIRKIVPFSWIDAFRFPPCLGNLGTLTTRTSWLRLFFLSSSYERWWDTVRKSFAFRSG